MGDWVQQMLFLLDENTGIVGPLLVHPDGAVYQSGVILSLNDTADTLCGVGAEHSDCYEPIVSTREVSAVTFECAMVRKSIFERIGGLKEYYETRYHDVDFCLRLRELGLRSLCTPRTRLIHHKCDPRNSTHAHLDRFLFNDCWGQEIASGDPYSRWQPEARVSHS